MARHEGWSPAHVGPFDGVKERSHGGERRELSLTRVFDAPIHLVWEMWTRGDHLGLWLTGPAGWALAMCEVDLREGGRWRLAWRREDDSELSIEGWYREVRPPHRLVSGSSWGAGWPDAVETLVLVEEPEGRTRVTQSTLYACEAALDAAVGRGVVEGMREAFDGLERYLATLLEAVG